MILTTYKGILITQRNNLFYVNGLPYKTIEEARQAIDLIISNNEAAAYHYYMMADASQQQSFQTYK